MTIMHSSDPGAPGLQITSDGQQKMVDVVDCTGSGDVSMKKVKPSGDLELPGATGRTLKLNPEWNNPSGTWYVGKKSLYSVSDHNCCCCNP